MSVPKIIIAIVIIAVLGGGGWWLYQRYSTACCAPDGVTAPVETKPALPPAPTNPNDADNDGISNADEKTKGLNPNEYDTDGDGLSDKAEIEQYKTDPKKADTDGDTFWDGVELMKGYNPLGPGRLPTSTKS